MKIVLKIAYEGSAFGGFQRQTRDRTVQGTLEAALSSILGHPVALHGAGRTDVGVHATGQVVSFHTSRSPGLSRLCHSLNSILREPLQVLEAVGLADDHPFQPRYSALARTYSYFVLDGCGPREARFWEGRAWCLPGRMDLQCARAAAALFVGEQDFSTFSYRMEGMESRVRRVSASEVTCQPATGLLSPEPGPRLFRFSITANGFLRRMVRLLTAGMVEVALGLRSQEDLALRLAACDPRQAPHPAPSAGLYLERVDYNPDPFSAHRGTPDHAVAKLRWRHRVKR